MVRSLICSLYYALPFYFRRQSVESNFFLFPFLFPFPFPFPFPSTSTFPLQFHSPFPPPPFLSTSDSFHFPFPFSIIFPFPESFPSLSLSFSLSFTLHFSTPSLWQFQRHRSLAALSGQADRPSSDAVLCARHWNNACLCVFIFYC